MRILNCNDNEKYFSLLFFLNTAYCTFTTQEFFSNTPNRITSHTDIYLGLTGPKTFCQTPRSFLQNDTPSLVNDQARTNSCTKTSLTIMTSLP